MFAGINEDLVLSGFSRLDQYLLGIRMIFVSTTLEMLLKGQDVDKGWLQGAYSDINAIMIILRAKGLKCEEIVGEGI